MACAADLVGAPLTLEEEEYQTLQGRVRSGGGHAVGRGPASKRVVCMLVRVSSNTASGLILLQAASLESAN